MKPNNSEAWRNSQTPVIKKRAQARWDALIHNDIAKVYGYTSPDYRAVVTLQQYRGKYGHALEWRMAQVKKVRYYSPTVASVSVDVTYRAYILGAGNKAIETSKLLTEKWFFKGGEWWYADQ